MDPAPDKYNLGLERVPANHAPLTPLSFLPQSAAVYPERIAVIHGPARYSYRDFQARCRRLASALAQRGVGRGDTVALLAPNVPATLEAHFGVPMTGAVLNPINFRLEPASVAFILRHGEAKVLLTDRELAPLARAALGQLEQRPLVVDIDDPLAAGTGELIGEISYDRLLDEGRPDYDWSPPRDEWDAIALSYTSGTTGDPKGVVYHHRGAYLAAFGHIPVWDLGKHPVYLWTLPIFHSFGWCFPWTITLLAGTHVLLRKVQARAVFSLIAEHGVTHLCAAPTVLNMLLQAGPEARSRLPRGVKIMTAAAPPPPAILQAVAELGFEIIHTYGLTEVYGPATVCARQDGWQDLAPAQRAARLARQGVAYPTIQGLMVADPQTLRPVPADGQTVGEVFFRGNPVMKGYLKDPAATQRAFDGGWFHTGDLGVLHPDGYLELKDRSKDIIISGGENISSIEVEAVLYRHPAIAEAAVVARPDPHWGEVPCAFVALKDGMRATAEEVMHFCREQLAHFKCPRHVVFGPLPKTSTGKIQKFLLRQQAASSSGDSM